MQTDPFWRSALVTALVDAGELGQVIRLARQHRGWRQADLGKATSYSSATISRLEQGRSAGLDVMKAKKVAGVLGMPAQTLAALLGVVGPPGATVVTRVAPVVQEDPMRRRNLLAVGLAAVPVAALTRLDDALALTPAPAAPATPAQVAALLADAHQNAAEGADEPATWMLVAAVYDMAAEALNKVGAASQSRLTADRAMTYAARSEDPVAQAAAARSLGIVLRHEGRQEVAQRLTMRAVTRLDHAGLTTPAQTAAYVQTLCTTAYNAALADDRDSALDMVAEARRAARGLPARMPARPTTAHRFKITLPQLALYEVGVRWGLGDAGAALAAGRHLRPEQFATPERRARLHTDMARAYVQRGRPEPAIARLLAAYGQAPSEVRDRPSIRRLAGGLIERHRRVPGARELAAIL